MKFAVLPGDDIGPEIMQATLAVLQEADARFGLGITTDVHEVGMSVHRQLGTTLPESAVEAARQADAVLLGPGGMAAYPPVSEGGINIPGTLRKRLDLFANIRPARSRPGVPMALPGLDCIVVRENTEGFYADRSLFHGHGEFMPTADVAISLRLVTARASRRIAEVAFRIAETRRKHVTMVGKRQVLQTTDGLFMQEVEKVAAGHPGVTLREMHVDAMAAELYIRPSAFDVIVTTNMFGDILSNLANALAGGLGLAAALNVGDTHMAANAGHGSAPDIAGQGFANPAGMILSAALLLRQLSLRPSEAVYADAAQAIEDAVDLVLEREETRTRDLGGRADTSVFTEALCHALRNHSVAARPRPRAIDP